MASLKRQSDDELLPVTKIQRIENLSPTSPLQRQANNDFSGVVKKKLADSKRTGQACDRCKVRPPSRWCKQSAGATFTGGAQWRALDAGRWTRREHDVVMDSRGRCSR